MVHNIDTLPAEILLGQQGEKGANSVLFNVLAWEALYPGLVVATNPGISDGLWLTYTRGGESTVYSEDAAQLDLDLTLDDGGNVTAAVLTWTPSDAALDVAGQGTVVIHLTGTGVEKRSVMTCTYVAPGHAAAGDPPEPLADYIEKWGAVDVEVTEKPADEELTQAVTQDSTGTHFALQIHKGNGIASIVRTAGAGAPGTTDTYTITFDDGTTQTYQVAHGVQGDTGASITAAAFDGNDILFTLDDASTVRITNGKTAVTGAPGVDGDTPVRGTDYWTAEDIAAIEAHCEDYIDTEILGGTS